MDGLEEWTQLKDGLSQKHISMDSLGVAAPAPEAVAQEGHTS